jgi:hypothetical protein
MTIIIDKEGTGTRPDRLIGTVYMADDGQS